MNIYVVKFSYLNLISIKQELKKEETLKRTKKRASGVDADITTLIALADIIEREKELEQNFQNDTQKVNEDRELAVSIRQQAVETFSETKKREGDTTEGAVPKKKNLEALETKCSSI